MAFIAKLGDQTYTVDIEEVGRSLYRIAVDGDEFLVDGKQTGQNNYSLIINHRSFEVDVDTSEEEYRVLVDGRSYHIHLVDERRMRLGGFQTGIQLQGKQEVTVPMAGNVIAVLVAEGDRVDKGQGLVIVEAMKMENEVRSPIDAEIKEVRVKTGQSVEAGETLMVVE
ncbi:MAG: biotin/lipoyl-containing protein [Candidatus Binatia bacterium]